MAGISFVVTVHDMRDVPPAVLGAIFTQEGDFARVYAFIADGSRDDSTPLRRPNLDVSSVPEAAPAETVLHGAIGQG
jgi:hypothetical protein